jgi:alkaline phosphatase
MKTKLLLGAALLTAPFAAASAQPAPKIKNVIVLVNDGGGPTVYDTLRIYNGSPLTTDRAFFKKTWVSTYPLRPDSSTNNTPSTDAQDPSSVYDSSKFWDTTIVSGNSTVSGYTAYPAAFKGYEFSRFAHPDSGNTATSLSSGVKTYNNAINVDGSGDPQVTIVDLLDAAKKGGKRTGVVSTVQFSDATPAALGGAHNVARANANAIAAEMFSRNDLDVIGGVGNPDYDDLGAQRSVPLYTWIAQDLWSDLKNGTNLSGANSGNFQLVQDKATINQLAQGDVTAPEKLAMIMKSFTSTQFNRAGETTNPLDPHTKEPYADPLKTDVPTQANLTLAALNALGKQTTKNGSTRGFYLMTEAGAVDRAEHANNLGRMVEEMSASEDTLKAIIDWVNRADTDANWNNTLLVVTADHDHLLYGPNGDTVPFQPIKSNGKGKLPGGRFFGPNHGTGLVPLYAYGKGSAELIALATKTDSYTDANGNTYGHGAYADQTDIGAFLKAALAQ